jgi:release factor glutamine methyltransferase
MNKQSVAQLLRDAIEAMNHDQARIDAELLLSYCLKKNRAWLFAHADDNVAEQDQKAFFELLHKRRAGEPIAYLLGSRGFWNFELKVNRHTLIPRPETELLVELALQQLPIESALNVLDMGTGTGAIAIAIASERPRTKIMALDASQETLNVAAENVAALDIKNIELIKSDWFSSVPEHLRFNLIVSNPPYISQRDPHLSQGDLRYEPISALASGEDGLDAIRIIVKHAPHYLLPSAGLVIEHGWDQSDAVRTMFSQAGFVDIETVQDLEQRDRVTFGQRPLELWERC